MKVMLSKYLFGDLSSLASRHVILLDCASELPVLVQMNAPPKHHWLESNDPDFWAVCSGKNSQGETVGLEVSWIAIADDWQEDQLSIAGFGE